MKVYIYKIYAEEDPDTFYVGGTWDINHRLENHNWKLKSEDCNWKLYKTIRDNPDYDWVMEVIHERDVATNEEKRKVEQEYQDTLNPSLNEIRAWRDNVEVARAKYIKNKEVYIKLATSWMCKRVVCEHCGKNLAQGSMRDHNRVFHPPVAEVATNPKGA